MLLLVPDSRSVSLASRICVVSFFFFSLLLRISKHGTSSANWQLGFTHIRLSCAQEKASVGFEGSRGGGMEGPQMGVCQCLECQMLFPAFPPRLYVKTIGDHSLY